MADVSWDMSDLESRLSVFMASVKAKVKQANEDVANAILLASQSEVPHVTGNLQNSGHVEDDGDTDKIVGYNTVYAAYMHEGVRVDGTHRITQYSDGRKGKYLEDPIRQNLDTLKKYYDNVFTQ